MHDPKQLIPCKWSRKWMASALVGLVPFVSGCGSSLPEVAPVRGVVTFDGKPLPEFKHAGVVFTPKAGMPASSVISPTDGSFVLTTYQSGDGARIGTHAVAVSATVDDRSANMEKDYPGLRFVIPEKFANRDSSGLEIEVKPGNNIVEIQLHSNGTGKVFAQ